MADYHAIATAAAQKYGVPVPVFLRQIGQESGWNPAARSPVGAQGIAQFMPATAKQYGVNTADPVSSLNGAARMMGDLIHRYGTVERALSAYNSGRPDAYKDPGFAGGQTFHYVKSIMGGTTPAPPAASPTLPVAPAATPGLGSAAPPAPRGIPSGLAMAVNQGNEMFGLPSLPASLLTPPAPTAAPTLTAPAARQPVIPGAPLPAVGGIAKTALTQLGTPYQWGGAAKLGGHTDCSGLLQASARANGINIGRTTYEQWKQGTAVPLNQLKPGDAVFFHPGPKGPEHVAIFIGGGRVVEDPHSGASVEISQLAGRGPMGARRYG